MKPIPTISRQSHFSYVFKNATKVMSRSFIAYISPAKYDTSCIAYVAGKKVGNAVKRSYSKRRLRHIANSMIRNFEKYDMILIAKKQIINEPYNRLELEFKYIIQQHIN